MEAPSAVSAHLPGPGVVKRPPGLEHLVNFVRTEAVPPDNVPPAADLTNVPRHTPFEVHPDGGLPGRLQEA